MPPAFEIKGWCPSAQRPMESGDGLLIRAKSRQSMLASTQLRAVADIATDCGNGLVDLTQRTQLQLRGLTTATLDEARRRLQEHKLFFPAQDSLVDILSGDPFAPAAFEVNALVETLARMKENDSALRDLPPKFLISVDTGCGLSLSDAQADIRIEAIDAARAAVCVAGAPDRGVIVAAQDVAATARRLMRAFAALRAERPFELRRMRHVVETLGLDALLRAAKLEMQACQWRAPVSLGAVLGAREAAPFICVGVAAPCGRWRASQLAALAALAEAHGAGAVATTHWRVFVVRAHDADAARGILDAARALDLIVSARDPRLAIAACPGAPECSQAQGETRGALARLAPLAQKLAGKDGVGLHVSGCAKGCARPARSPVTLVANDSAFDLVEDGRASDAPRLSGLDIDAVERALISRAEEHECPT